MSRPAWARGLKHKLFIDGISGYNVAPRMGAWIETTISVISLGLYLVAPRMGAWIETYKLRFHHQVILSRAPHGRVD